MQQGAEQGPTGGSLKTSLGIVGTGAALVFGALAVGVLMCGGGFGSQVLQRLPEIAFAPEPVMIPATDPRLPKVSGPSIPVARNPPPHRNPPRRWTEPEPVFQDPPRWTEPGPDAAIPIPLTPEPRGVPEPLVPLVDPPVPALAPVPTQPQPPVPTAPAGPLASVGVSGDAASILARSSGGQVTVLPGALPPGTYDIVVTFPGREPFAATTMLVLDATPRSVICRASLGICKVR